MKRYKNVEAPKNNNEASEISYESICEKLGFDVDTYEVPQADTEDGNGESPFRKLSLEELNFLTDRIESKKADEAGGK